MAVQEDYEAYERWFYAWTDQISIEEKGVEEIVLCSPDSKQLELVRRIYPDAYCYITTPENWNLYNPCPYGSVDLVVACNVFHYLSHPQDALRNIFAASRFFWMQDLILRYRGGDSEFGNDGDCMRYLYDPDKSYLTIYNLGAHQDRLLDYKVYDGGSKQNKRATIHFMAFFRGDVK